MEFIKAKNIIIRNKSTAWFGAFYNMNIYKGCNGGCIYCDSRSSCYKIDDFDRVRIKEDALRIIRDDLRRKVKKGMIATGAMSDPYNSFEKEYKLTRNAFELINAYNFPAMLATKSDLVLRDIDILSDIKKHSPAVVKMTITTYDDELSRKIETGSSVSSKRFDAIEKLSQNGIYSGVLMMPILPFINDNKDNIINIIRKSKDVGAKFIYPAFGVTLRDNQREWYYNELDKKFKGLREKYEKRYGYRYSCGSKDFKVLSEIFINECEKLGILYKMDAIIKSYKVGYEDTQLSFLNN